MQLLQTFSVLLASVWVAAAQSSVDQYITRMTPISKRGILANIGPNGANARNAQPGVVIASPDNDPDYRFFWTRDAALTYKALTEQFTSGEDTTLRPLIDDFARSTARFQALNTPSGSAASLESLGEPKFKMDISPFTEPWGRPQRDGPPLRATAIIGYANYLISTGNQTYVANTLWPIIKKDLDYTARFWNNTGFDLWEEVSSSSYFTTAAQHRALREGVTLAKALGQTAVVADYEKQAANTLCFMQSYWNPAGYVTANTGGGRSGKDANTILASIHTFDVSAGCDAKTLQPCSDKALSNLFQYVNAFRTAYALNSGIPANQAVATGRYTEDVYYGGNPWYLTTLAVAEQLYDALIVWKRQGSLQVTATSLPFFRTFSSGVTAGSYASNTATFTTLTTAVKTFADGFVSVVEKYTPANGALAEQYSRSNGTPLSATDLTWSYASALTAFAARDGYIPSSWGAAGLAVPATCERNTGGGGGNTVAVTFRAQATTVFGENIFITGSVNELQNWSPEAAVALSAASYPTWTVTVNLPANTRVEYKYIRKNNGVVTWESDPNRVLTTPASGTFTQNDSWR
ncbi:glucoamylase [Pterulicium gracile]|uniref:Glucoamylase n=1 Tax=Pterulicium gracile TaxID=1884261 RepID=A0A5C3R0C9_9AGAR|nr:glucoamylase [Pterula gracilis]